MEYLLFLPACLAAAAIGYSVQALLAVRAFARATLPAPAGPAAVSLLKPLHGAEPELAANLAGFLQQDWAAPIQMVAGANRSDDAAIAVARALGGDVTVLAGAPALGANAKIANLAHMAPAARHDLLILSDSDIAVPRDYIARVASALAGPGVGVATCLYHGHGVAGGWSRLLAAGLDWQFVPSVATAIRLGTDHPCMGSTIALRRETLAAIGGFAAFADVLADDHAIGAAVRATGQALVVVPAFTVTHDCTEASLAAVWRHELRWAVTVRGVVGTRYPLVLLTHPLPLALLAAMAWPAGGLVLVAAALGLRLLIARAVRQLTGKWPAPIAWLPARDLLSFAVFLASLGTRSVDWRGARLRMAGDGRVSAEPELP